MIIFHITYSRFYFFPEILHELVILYKSPYNIWFVMDVRQYDCPVEFLGIKLNDFIARVRMPANDQDALGFLMVYSRDVIIIGE